MRVVAFALVTVASLHVLLNRVILVHVQQPSAPYALSDRQQLNNLIWRTTSPNRPQ